MLEASMTEKQLRRFLQVMVDNLVDSNVFMRSLVLSVEHSSFRQEFRAAAGEGDDEEEDDGDEEEKEEEEEAETAPRLEGGPGAAAGGREEALSAAGGDGCGRRSSLEVSNDAELQGKDDEEKEGGGGGGEGYGHRGDGGDWLDSDGDEEPCYLGHTWYDVQPQEVPLEDGGGLGEGEKRDREKPSKDRGSGEVKEPVAAGEQKAEGKGELKLLEGRVTAAAAALVASREAARVREARRGAGKTGGGAAGAGGLTRLQCFLKHNTPQLVRDLMCVVNLETINHENICCLNTAVLILIFADRRGQLAEVKIGERGVR